MNINGIGEQVVDFKELIIQSNNLNRDVLIDVYHPDDKAGKLPLLLVNDGQDLRTMNFCSILADLIKKKQISPLICIAIHCGSDRMNEYGTACMTDFAGRGSKAKNYHRFILDELLPNLHTIIPRGIAEISIAGFSMGGLSAFDLAWTNPDKFSKVGVFSGSLWWRKHDYSDPKYNILTDRIIHSQVQNGLHHPHLSFFFECGQLDETADRNNNGIIDSIDDTLDLIQLLKEIGYPSRQIRYYEMADGRHDVATWAKAFPEFLKWGWKN